MSRRDEKLRTPADFSEKWKEREESPKSKSWRSLCYVVLVICGGEASSRRIEVNGTVC